MSEDRALIVQQPQGLALNTMADLLSFGDVMVKSGMFPDVKSQAQAVVKIVAGRELGLPPLYSLRKIYVINGQVTLSADAMAGLIKRSGEYDYEVVKLDNDGCSIQFTRNGKPCGPPSTFTKQDATNAGLTTGNWSKYARNMMFARALSNGARWYCPHVIGGAYTPDEMGTLVNAEGDALVIDHRPPAEEPAFEPTPMKAQQPVHEPIMPAAITAEQKATLWNIAKGKGFTVEQLQADCRGRYGVEIGALTIDLADEYIEMAQGWQSIA